MPPEPPVPPVDERDPAPATDAIDALIRFMRLIVRHGEHKRALFGRQTRQEIQRRSDPVADDKNQLARFEAGRRLIGVAD